MEPTLFFFFLVPILVMVVARVVFHHKTTIEESILQVLIPVALIAAIWYPTRYHGASDVELWNGEVIATIPEKRACPTGWRSSQDSFCTEYDTRQVYAGESCSGTGKDRTCHSVYNTEYEYDFPWERRYFIKTSFDTHEVRRIDRQGVKYPPKFSAVNVGDYAAAKNGYSNWLRAAAGNIYFEDGKVEEKYKDYLPAYPIKVYDFYKVDRLVVVGDVTVDRSVNDKIGNILKELGPKKQMNIVMVVADASVLGQDYPYALRKAWFGFKKNDAVIFVGIKDNVLQWAEVMSWSKQSLFNVELRDAILSQLNKPVNFDRILDDTKTIGLTTYERRSMKEFEYLKKDIPIPTLTIVMATLFSIFGSIGLAILFTKVDIQFIPRKRNETFRNYSRR